MPDPNERENFILSVSGEVAELSFQLNYWKFQLGN